MGGYYPLSVSSTDTLLAELRSGLVSLVAAARQEGRDEALAELRQVLGGGSSSTSTSKKTGRRRASPAKKPAAKKAKKKTRRNPWEGLTDEQRLARVNAIRKGRGLPPKDAL